MGAFNSSPKDNISQEENEEEELKKQSASSSLYFPPEIILNILSHLTPRDKLIARAVCHDWNAFISYSSGLESDVILHVEDTEDILVNLAEFPAQPIWTQYILRNVDLSKKSSRFWSLNSDLITRLSFVSCATIEVLSSSELSESPSTSSQSNNANNNEFVLGCNNLRSLSMNNCGKYFMMGSKFVQIHKILNLENLESLDLSNNANLNDRILFSFLMKTTKLSSLNLSDCPMTFANSVFQRFYPTMSRASLAPPESGQVISNPPTPNDCSDYILSFQMLYYGFLAPNSANGNPPRLKELILNSTTIDKQSLKTISEFSNFQWTSIGLNRCNELRPANFIDFFESQNHLEKLQLEKTKITDAALNFSQINLTNLTRLVLTECTEVKNLEFLKSTTKLEYLDISYCTSIDFRASTGCLSSLVNLKVLKLRGIVPFYIHAVANQDEVSSILATEFSKLCHLVQLDVGMCGSIINDVVMQSIIQHMRSLQVLKIDKAPVTDAGLTGIIESNSTIPRFCMSRLTDLRQLSLTQCELIGEYTWTHAISFPSLRYLDLSRCLNLSVNGLLSIVQSCRSLEEFILTNSIRQVHDQGQTRINIGENIELFTTIQKLPRLKNLIINSINYS